LAALIFTLPGLWFACLFALTAALLVSLALWQPMRDVYPHQPVAVQTVQPYADVQLLRERRTASKCSLHLRELRTIRELVRLSILKCSFKRFTP